MTDSVNVNVTLDGKQLAELKFTPLGDGDWSARCAVLLPGGLKMMQMAVPSYPDDLNAMGLILSVISRLPEEAFVGPISPPDMARGLSRALPEV